MVKPLIYRPPQTPLAVIHRDDSILVLDKPSGLLSVPGRALEHRDCLIDRARVEFPGVLLVHRLDMDTSGIIIFALTRSAQRHLGLQFERRQTAKSYVARVRGQVAQDAGTVDLPLIVDWPNRPLQKVDFETGRSAQTRWRVMSREPDATRMELTPVTGRSHQLRVHMQQIGHPILGDELYGDAAAIAAADRLQLHARDLELFHPDTGDRTVFSSQPPF